MPQYLMLDPLPFALEQTAVPTTTEPTTPTTPTEPTTPTDPTTPSDPATTDFPDIDGHWGCRFAAQGC